MDVSRSNYATELNGQELVQKVIAYTGLPEALILDELALILDCSGIDINRLTLSHLRVALAAHLEVLSSQMTSSIDVL